ncbi:MAG: histone deacetylase family protein [bacterium]|nr:histone deacetylase family protein [bacterium]
MTQSPLLTLYSPHHALHAPRGEFLHGRIVPYYEMPRRMENIHQAVLASDLFDAVEPTSNLHPDHLAHIHDPQMIAYLSALADDSQRRIRADYAVYGLTDQLTDDEYYYESIFHTPDNTKTGLHNPPKLYFSDSTCPIGKNTWKAVMASATLAYQVAQTLLAGTKKAYALCRPPGHHAGRDFVGGYCYVNNAALAASRMSELGKVAILDVDYHHGNGTQDIFYDDPNVFFVSLHADPAIDYPHTTGYADEIGAGAGEGFNMNIPMPHGTDENAYFVALDRALRAIQDFGAQALVVSLGFDTYINDPMGAFELTIGSYERMGRMIDAMSLPTAYIQEGGYAVDELGILATSFFTGVLANG